MTRWPDLPIQERLHRKFQMKMDEKPAADKKAPVVLEPGSAFDVDKLPKGQVAEVAKLLRDNGRRVLAKRSQTMVEGQVYGPKAKKAGQKAADKKFYNYGLATGDKQYPVVSAAWINGKMEYAKVLAEPGGQVVEFDLVTTLKKFLKGELSG